MSIDFKWNLRHKKGDKNAFSEYFEAKKFKWRIGAVTSDRHIIFLEYYGYLPFDVFTDYVLHVTYEGGKREEHSVFFAFNTYESDFGVFVDDRAIRSVEVEITRAVRCYESKKTAPYAGMRNLGATCYINSLIQSLFHITDFRRQLLLQDTTKNKEKTLEMQKLFYKLESEPGPVEPNAFAEAFKLKESIDSQQDIQEFCKILLDILENESKSQPFFDYIERMFYGKMCCSIACAKGCKSEKIEKYNDIQLVISSPFSEVVSSTLEDALQAYVTTANLEGANMYNCEKHGYVNAQRRDYFKSFPPILFFQIKRFDMDLDTGLTYKVNDLFCSPERINLGKYKGLPSGAESDDNYTLHSINVHVGEGPFEGHYYAYIKKADSWYKFNDGYVTKVTEHEAIEGTYGGRHEYKDKMKTANAYLLVYIQDQMREQLLSPETVSVPPHVSEQVEQERMLTRERELRIFTKASTRGYWGAGKCSWDQTDYEMSPYFVIRPLMPTAIQDLKSMLEVKLGISRKRIRTPSRAMDYDSSGEESESVLDVEDTIYLFRADESLEEVDCARVVDLKSSSLFVLYDRKDLDFASRNIILFVKTYDTGRDGLAGNAPKGQPCEHMVMGEDVVVVDRDDFIEHWFMSYSRIGSLQLFLEEDKDVRELGTGKTFGEEIKGHTGIILVPKRKDEGDAYSALARYYQALRSNCTVRFVFDGGYELREWMGLDCVDVEERIGERGLSNEFTVEPKISSSVGEVKGDLDRNTFRVTCNEGHVAVGYISLGSRTANPNATLVPHVLILPKTVKGDVFLQKTKQLFWDQSAQETPEIAELAGSPSSKLGLVVTESGLSEIKTYSLKDEVALASGALVVLQNIHRKKMAEAMVLDQQSGLVIGHPFFIDADVGRSVMETKRKYCLEDSTAYRLSSDGKKERELRETSTLRRDHSSDRFLFKVSRF